MKLIKSILTMKLLYITMAMIATILPGPTQATVITFNGSAPEGGETLFSGTYTEAGYTITHNAGTMFFLDNNDQSNAFPGILGFDDDVLEFNDDASPQFTLTKDGGGMFDLVSVITGSLGRFQSDDGDFIFTGNLSGGGTIMTTVAGLLAPSTTFFAGFTSLTSVIVTSSDGYFPVMDNLTLADSVVPAPATLALFGLGLTGLGWSRRKKA